jgi:DNA-binding NarL/FixJ family response regulator
MVPWKARSMQSAGERQPGLGSLWDTQDKLTAREKEVLALMVEGLTNRQIADKLIVSASRGRTHVYTILDKMQVPSRVQVVTRVLRSQAAVASVVNRRAS